MSALDLGTQKRFRSAEGLSGPLIRVKTGKGQREHMFSAVHPITDSTRTSRHVSNVPLASF
jgi:hypothetical protein